MIAKLSQFILDDADGNDADTLIRDNDKMRAQINQLQYKINKVVIDEYASLSSSEKLDKIIDILSISDHELQLEQQALNNQKSYITTLISFISIYISNTSSTPHLLQRKQADLQKLLSSSIQLNHPKPQIDKLRQWTLKMTQNLQKKLCDLVSDFSSHFLIKIGEIQGAYDLLNQDAVVQFVRAVGSTVFQYDVPTESYLLKVPQKIEESGEAQNRVLKIERELIIFKCEQTEKHFPKIHESIQKTKQIAGIISRSLPESLQQTASTALYNCLQSLQSQLQYILPYMSLPHRKQIIQSLCTKKTEESTLYDILVRLRLKGQDGQMMESNICQLVEKIKANVSLIDDVIIFLEMCESQGRILNIGFYLCEQLIERLEGVVNYGVIQGLLRLREDIRFKIHNPV